jgi:hypothetical protein
VTVFWIVLVVALVFMAVRGVDRSKALSRGEGPKVIVETVKGDAAARRTIEYYLSRGYELQGQGSRKVVWSPVTGVFTRKQKHTLTFVKAASAERPQTLT